MIRVLPLRSHIQKEISSLSELRDMTGRNLELKQVDCLALCSLTQQQCLSVEGSEEYEKGIVPGR